MKKELGLISLLMLQEAALAQAELTPFALQTTVATYAIECQHSGKKSFPRERNTLCVSYINAAVHQIAISKRSPKCWEELDNGAGAPGPIMDVLFYMAAQPREKNLLLGDAVRSVVVDVAAKNCK